ncbi:hypothetical protein BN137_1564 [Cronobacter condimenti 1330]|uniref:Uncharacterized protein n=1 Tax=Cronobacter condimenti 1330 TaxID=1073999 RepID=K8A8X8_9ENTR|nr:hypothetical protein BN137_1564 [Cronobacter condimenti 1330]
MCAWRFPYGLDVARPYPRLRFDSGLSSSPKYIENGVSGSNVSGKKATRIDGGRLWQS